MDKPLLLRSARTLKITYNLPISRTSKFWKGLEEGKVYATQCKKCEKLHFPPVADCGDCFSSKVEWIQLDGKGEIVTYTHVFVKPASFTDQPTYTVAIAKLKEGIQALAWLTGIEKEQVKVGMTVKLIAKIFANRRVTYEFIPLENKTEK
jgi:uncharacterized OB-fold protein